MRKVWMAVLSGSVVTGAFAGGCGDSANTGGAGGTSSSNTGSSHTSSNNTASSSATGLAADAQTPPQEATALEAWLKKGDYKTWHCETAVHAARSPSPHSFNRICSNDILAADVSGTGNWKKGAAGVKELYASVADTVPVGYAVYLKIADDSAAGANWYYYERVPLDSAAPHDANGVVANGFGSAGTANTICVDCHKAAGSDAAHTPTAGGHDFVYTPVP